MIAMPNNGPIYYPRSAHSWSKPEPDIPLSKRIQIMIDSIEPIIDRMTREATDRDVTRSWVAACMVEQALRRAQVELSVAALTLGIEEDLR